MSLTFEDLELARILTQQKKPVRVLDSRGRLYQEIPASKALLLLGRGPYLGRGNKNMIRFIQPVADENGDVIEPGLGTVYEVRMAFASAGPESQHVTRHKQNPGAIDWVWRPDNAHTGHSSGHKVVFRKSEKIGSVGDPQSHRDFIPTH